MHRRYLSLVLLVLVAVAAVPAFGAHAWGNYHWPKAATGEVTVPVTMNISGQWPSYASRVMADWNSSNEINSPWSFGAISSTKRCTSAAGQIEVCNNTYGQNGWLGIAGISISGSHITKGYTKLNDSYYNTAQYNTPAWRQMVFCQEVGHDYGLGHQNEIFNNVNVGSCMDYTNAPQGGIVNGFNYGAANLYPNAHDYAQLVTIYSHSDSTLPFDAMTADATRPRKLEEALADAGQWGTPIAFDAEGMPTTFFLKTGTNHDGHEEGNLIHVFWAPIDPFADTRGPGHGHDQ
jgi:hypothetical protein